MALKNIKAYLPDIINKLIFQCELMFKFVLLVMKCRTFSAATLILLYSASQSEPKAQTPKKIL